MRHPRIHMLVRLLASLVVTAALAPGVGAARARQEDQRVARVQEALTRGAYADAEREARDLTERLSADSSAAPIDRIRAQALLVDALLRNGQAAAPATLALAKEVLARREEQGEPAALDTASSLHALAAVRLERGEAALARPLDERGLAIRTRLLPADSPAVADSLERLADTLTRLEHIEPARRLLTRALAIREARADIDPLALARSLGLLCAALRDGGFYADAEQPLERLLAIWRTHAPEHPDAAWVQVVAGDLRWLLGDVDAGRAAWANGLALAQRTVGEDHPGVVALQRRIVIADDVRGMRDEAQKLVDRSLPGARRGLAPCNIERLSLEEYVASRAEYDGAYLESRRQYEQSLAAHTACLGPRHSLTATVLYNLGLLAIQMGDFDEAERRLGAATRAWSAGLGPTHPFVARGWDAQAEAAAARGEYARARLLYERALTARRRAAKPNLPHVAWTLTNLSRTQAALGGLTLARRQVREAIQIFESAGASDEPDHLARALALRGEIEGRLGDLTAAHASFVEALATREKIFGASHPLTAQSRADLASAALRLRQYEPALTDALVAEQAGRDHLRFTIRYLPERQAMNYAARRPRGLDLALSIAALGTAAGTLAPAPALLDAVIQSRGVILDELAVRARAAEASDASIAALVAPAISARQRFANLVVRSLQEPVDRSLLDQARREKESAEEALAERSVEARNEQARVRIGLDDVRKALPGDAALVSFVRYDRTPVTPAGSPPRWRRPVASYGAFVLRSGAPSPSFVPLGAAASIDALITSWRREASGRTLSAGAPLADAERAYRVVAWRLRQAIWDPLAPPLAGAAHVFVVPDGQVNVVNLNALPERAGRFLADEPATIHYLTTERDLVPTTNSEARTSLLAVGGATFDGDTLAAPAPTAERSACEAFSRMRFAALPGSRREVAEISRAWPEGDARDVTVLSGAAATETAVKQAVSGRRVVHLATHGFFLGGECIPGLVGTRGVGGLARRTSSASADTDNPLLLSGLALAWANRRDRARDRQDDGILTAEEIAALNLHGTEWAVLSACDTGLGEIKAGEGVFGLRRAFQIAGARTVIMSLWAVEDGAARVWMRALYDGRFRRHFTTSEAVGAASRSVLADRRARGLSTHPFYWAGFVAAGDWR